ncbi:hypothetical protein GUITHDRAFT_121275 [Guillardia theta CCMP2712]|uniref:Uncharacterized protein n=1 Tax=Guillardia theta (strain CCMP2712) TaxID=905079 RepID=L1I8G9_GUITC|nr:hypothetical protein GUITHDRAFT_121275 [Guillardia theta CCMP2712]EKX32566.1 hypothetical protein GUITHDRAFT_121275 [Guillardia theta CCMP2712]|eukprot:XP_005819546.1 hypothetical protein GUITHDRAFT_121275 [Guillardia theta CCMP2712]
MSEVETSLPTAMKQICSNLKNGLYAFVQKEGSSAVAQAPEQMEETRSRFSWLRFEKGDDDALSHRQLLRSLRQEHSPLSCWVYVGTRRGTVLSFNVQQSPSGDQLRVEPLGEMLAEAQGGMQGCAVTAMAWDSGCSTLACLYAGGKRTGNYLKLWSFSGSCTGTALRPAGEEAEGHRVMVPALSAAQEDLHEGENGAVCWSGDGYKLLVSRGSDGYIYELSLVRPSFNTRSRSSGGGSRVGSDRSVLQGEDRLLVLRTEISSLAKGAESYNADDPLGGLPTSLGGEGWLHILLPDAYTDERGSVTHAAMDESERFLAVSCTRGFCVFDRILSRWRLFGDVHQEYSLLCAGLLWLQHCILFLNETPGAATSSSSSESSYEILLFSRERLDFLSIILRIPLDRKPLAVDCHKDALVVMDESRCLHWYRVSVRDHTHPLLSSLGSGGAGSFWSFLGLEEDVTGRTRSASFHKTSSSKLSWAVHPESISLFDLEGGDAPVPSDGRQEQELQEQDQGTGRLACLLHFVNGDLAVVQEEDNVELEVLATEVDDFWLSRALAGH